MFQIAHCNCDILLNVFFLRYLYNTHVFYKFEYRNSFCISCHYLHWIAKFLTPISLHGSSLTAFPYRYQEFVKTWKLVFFTSLGYENTPELIGFILTVAYKASKVKLLFSRHCDTAAASTSYYTRVSAKIVVVTMYYYIQLQTSTFFVGGTSFRKSSKRYMYISKVWVKKKYSHVIA